MRKQYLVELVRPYCTNDQIANTLVQKLIDEGVVNEHYGNQEVSEVIETFKKVSGSTATSKYDRFAASRLVKAHGADQVVQVIQALFMLQGRDFAPTANNVSQVERKWVSIIKFLSNQRSEEEVDL